MQGLSTELGVVVEAEVGHHHHRHCPRQRLLARHPSLAAARQRNPPSHRQWIYSLLDYCWPSLPLPLQQELQLELQVLYWLAPALIPVPLLSLQELLQRELQVSPTMPGFAQVPDASCLGRRGIPERRCHRHQHDRLGIQMPGTLCAKMCIMAFNGGGEERQEQNEVVIAFFL